MIFTIRSLRFGAARPAARAPRRRLAAPAAASLLCLWAAQAALAGQITVDVTAKSGAPAQDAVIWLDPLDGMPPATHGAAVVDQVNKHFVPRVTVVRTGTAITFPNSDHIRHQVYSFSPAKTFSLKLYAGSPNIAVDFDRPGLVVLGCNIHDQMVAFVGVVDTPYFAKTPASGIATLQLPPGRYRLRAWHSNAVSAFPAREITVGGEAGSIAVSIDLDDAAARAAEWPE